MSTIGSRKAYASDLTNKQWLVLEPLLPRQKVNGRKRHLLVDTRGLIITVVVTVVSVQDRDGGKLVFSQTKDQPRLEKVWADGGNRGEFVRWTWEHCDWELDAVRRLPRQEGAKNSINHE